MAVSIVPAVRPVHAGRFGASRVLVAGVPVVVYHTSESPEGYPWARNLSAFMASPPTATNQASYHVATDDRETVRGVPDSVVAYGAAGMNAVGLHVAIAGKAAQSIVDWRDPVSVHSTRRAGLVGNVWRGLYSIPTRFLLGADMARGVRGGFTTHREVTAAKLSPTATHTDPGPAWAPSGQSFLWAAYCGFPMENRYGLAALTLPEVLSGLRAFFGLPGGTAPYDAALAVKVDDFRRFFRLAPGDSAGWWGCLDLCCDLADRHRVLDLGPWYGAFAGKKVTA